MNKDELTPPVSELDHVRGPSSAAVTLVQYGDYECPFTIQAHWQIELLLKNFPKQFRFVFRQFPLVKRHHFAMRAAESTEAAGAQGKFWEMHNGFLTQKFHLGWEGILEGARTLNLDLTRFESEVLEHVHRPRIQEQINSGIRSGVASTPSYFLNGAYYDGPDQYDDFISRIKEISRF
jgi:protein-disulfide isomerase